MFLMTLREKLTIRPEKPFGLHLSPAKYLQRTSQFVHSAIESAD
jgi:hypothetical protein